MKKLIQIGLLVASTTVSHAALYKVQSFLNGYNLAVTNNATVTAGYTNNLYTTPQGQIVQSFQTNGFQTNFYAGDAFQPVTLSADANGDVVSNAVILVTINNTNLIPIAVTNSVGQWFIPPAGFTNAQLTTAYTGWPLGTQAYPVWMYPATTNIYATTLMSTASTNSVTFNFVRSLDATGNQWETAASFSFTVAETASASTTVITNLPAMWLTGGRLAKVLTVVSPNNYSAGSGAIVNLLQLGQWTP